MARQSTVVDVFLSSPGDLELERNFIVAAAQEWNLLRSRPTGCHINIIKWEDIIAPALSERPQAVINEQVGDEYDVYLGIMWSRLGSPTGKAESGTVEEFNQALERYRSGEAVRLAMIFKVAPIPVGILDGAQFSKVNEFKKQFAAEGGLYREFATEEELRPILNRLFEQIAADKEAITEAADRARNACITTTSDGSEASPKSGEMAEMGLIELNEEFSAVTGEQTKFFDEWTKAMSQNAREVELATAEMIGITKFGNADPSALKPLMARLSGSMDELSQFIERHLAGFTQRNDRMIELTELSFDIAQDFDEQTSGKESLEEAIRQTLEMLAGNRNNVEGYIETVREIPRLSTNFNRARTRTISAHQAMIHELDRLRAGLDSIVNSPT